MKRTLLIVATVALGALVGAAPGQAAGHAVEMRNNSYNPPDMTVVVGDTVVWHNFDAETHSVVGGPINSPDVAPGGEFSYTFSGPAEISYTCRFHPYMSGVVRATSGGAPAAAPSASPSASPGTTAAPSASPVTTAMASSAPTSPPPASRMAIASETLPELVAETTTTVVEIVTTTTAPSVATTVAESAIGLAGSSSSSTGVWLLGALVVIALACFFGVRALRKNTTTP